jgi:outer membrane protein TolC
MNHNKYNILCYIALIIVILLQQSTSFSKTISLDEYLLQVKEKNSLFDAANQGAQAHTKLQKKSDLVSAPTFFATAKSGYKEQLPILTPFRYKRLNTQNYSVGVSQNSDLGINTKLSFEVNKTLYSGLTTSTTNTLGIANYQARPLVEVNIPLLQGRFGSSISAQKNAIKYDEQFKKFADESTAKRVIIEAKQTYFSLAEAQKILSIQKIAFKRAVDILNYVTKKEKMNLGEKSDVLQAKAAVEAKSLETQQAKNNEQYLGRIFNRYRGLDSEEAEDDLANIDLALLVVKENMEKNYNKSSDLKAVEARMNALVSSAKTEEENNKPKLDLYGSYGFNGINKDVDDVIRYAHRNSGREAFVGMNFSVPLYIGHSIDIVNGAKMLASSQKKDYKFRILEEETDWKNLSAEIEFYKSGLELSKSIENAQKLKLENEKKLLNQGRANTYQVLLFEQDYCQAQINTVRIASRLLSLIAKRDMYS